MYFIFTLKVKVCLSRSHSMVYHLAIICLFVYLGIIPCIRVKLLRDFNFQYSGYYLDSMKLLEGKEKCIFKNSYLTIRQKLNIHKYNIVRTIKKGNNFLHNLDHEKIF